MHSKLEAVNLMLEAIGEDPVSSLTSGLDDFAAAERILDRTKKQVLQKGWQSNTDGLIEDYTWARDSSNLVLLGDDVLRIDTVGPSAYLHGRKKYNESESRYQLWDTKNARWTWTTDPYVYVVWNQEWEELSDALNNYIAHEAAVRLALTELGSIALSEVLKADRDNAWNDLMDEETENQDFNILRRSKHALRISQRPGRQYTGF